jgi:hypothetical protein
MAEKKSSDSSKSESSKKPVAAKLFNDVKKPNETTVSATSKPIITGHQISIKRDPMVSPIAEQKPAEPETPPEETSLIADKPKREIKIKPLSDDEKTQLDDEPTPEVTPDNDDDQPAETAETEVAPESEEQTVDTTSDVVEEITEPDDQPASSEPSAGAVDAIVETINTKKERTESEQKMQQINNEVKQLIDSKKYHVKIRPAPNKRKLRALIVFLVIGCLAGSAWYLGYGPGKDLWLAKVDDNQPVVTQKSTTQQTTDTAKSQPQVLAFTNKDINTTFSYPKDWKVAVTADDANDKFNVITLTSQNVEVDSIVKDQPTVKAGVFLRTKIIVENTKDAKENVSKLVALANCESEDIIIGTTNLKLLYTDGVEKSPNVSKLSLSPAICKASGALFDGDDQVQLSTKQNTYVIYTEYVFSQEYLEKAGTKDAEAVATAQESGVLTTKDSFKSATVYKQLITTLKTLKEL